MSKPPPPFSDIFWRFLFFFFLFVSSLLPRFFAHCIFFQNDLHCLPGTRHLENISLPVFGSDLLTAPFFFSSRLLLYFCLYSISISHKNLHFCLRLRAVLPIRSRSTSKAVAGIISCHHNSKSATWVGRVKRGGGSIVSRLRGDIKGTRKLIFSLS